MICQTEGEKGGMTGHIEHDAAKKDKLENTRGIPLDVVQADGLAT